MTQSRRRPSSSSSSSSSSPRFLSPPFIFSAAGEISLLNARKLHPSSFSYPRPSLSLSPSPPRHRASALRIHTLVNFGCPHLRLIDSNRLAAAKLSNLTRGRAAACRGVNARETRFQGKHRVGYSLSLTLSPRDFFLLPPSTLIDASTVRSRTFHRSTVDDRYLPFSFVPSKLEVHVECTRVILIFILVDFVFGHTRAKAS